MTFTISKNHLIIKVILWMSIMLSCGLYAIPVRAQQKLSIKQRCETNQDCPSNSFCGYGCGGGKIWAVNSPEEFFREFCTGFCVPLTGRVKRVVKGPYKDVVNRKGEVVFKSDSLIAGRKKMNWMSAKNWCLAHKKKLIDISNNRLDCLIPTPEIYTYYTGGSNGYTIGWVGGYNIQNDPSQWIQYKNAGLQFCYLSFVLPSNRMSGDKPVFTLSMTLQGLYTMLSDVDYAPASFWTGNIYPAKFSGAWTIVYRKDNHPHILQREMLADLNYPLCE